MKLKRVIILPTRTKETLTLEMDVDAENFIYSVDFMEKRVQEIYAFYKGEVKVPKSTPKKEEKVKKVISKPPSGEGTAFDSIPLDAKEFNLFNVTVTHVGEAQSGTTAGKDWSMQSVSIKDSKGKTRELIAWADQTSIFGIVSVGDVLDIDLLSKVIEYTNKKGATTIQYQIGSNTEIRGAE